MRNDAIDIPALFRESYGIWNNPEDPVEEIVLKYDVLDGAFVKTMPIHPTQELTIHPTGLPYVYNCVLPTISSWLCWLAAVLSKS